MSRARPTSPRSDVLVEDHQRVLAETSPTSKTVGLYIHMPFCAKRCYFCSFNTAPMDERALKQYVGALHRETELIATLPWASEVGIETIFFGGGTPSLLPPATLDAILEALHTRLRVGGDIEITVECNPESVSSDSLAGYHDAGVNRISLGVQSLDDALLTRVGRLHDGRGARAAFEAARDAGFTNVSVDLMYGLPGLDVARWSRTVDEVLGWNPDHVSAYGLTLDAGSLWGARGIDGLPDEETVLEQYWVLARAAAARGFEHYEISNYARPGFRSRHNQIYWRRGEYLACGPGAAGFIGDLRWSNVRPVTRYCSMLDAGHLPVDTSERLDARQVLGERLILGLRTIDGVPSAWLAERANGDRAVTARLDVWRQQGWLEERAGRIRLTESGFLLSDALFVELL